LAELLLIRHAVNDYVKTGRLAGWTPGVHLNEEGLAQAAALGERLANTKLDAIYSSPLERTVETAQAILAHHPDLQLQTVEDVGELKIGDWQGAELSKLYRRKQWFMVQAFPSRTTFPNGETFRKAQIRAIDALEAIAQQHARGRVAVVSHADILKLVLAYYIGAPLDMFQRINVSPASLSIVSVGYGRITVQQINETSYLPQPKKGDGSVVELRPVHSLAVEAIGVPGQRMFYFQAQHGEDQVTTLDIEKTQALLLADEIDKLFASGLEAPALDEPVPLREGQSSVFRAGKIALQYEQNDDMIMIEFTELLGAEQGTPRVLKVWCTRQQARTLGEQARQVARRGRSES
jgi:probable phosphoglycerate mutase